jgi:ankyrin repeat protein
MGKQNLNKDISELLNAMKNADISAVKNVLKRYNYTELHFALMECSVSRIRRLLERGADPNTANEVGMTPLHYAAQDCPEAVSLLLKAGADPNARDEGGMTPLHIAALRGNAKAAELLLQHSDVNARDKNNRTPLHLALEYSHCDAALVLAADGRADVNARDGHGRTPLHYAATSGCVEVMRRLLERGADPSTRDKDGNTPLHFAAKSMNKDAVMLVLTWLKDVKDCINARNSMGETPLRWLLRECARWEERRRCYEAAKVLVEYGADPNMPDSRGHTPLKTAQLLGYAELIELLKG